MIDYYDDEAFSSQDETFHPDELPIQSDYESIRTFEDYEFTQCIAYEMAIRDPIQKERVDAIMDIYSKHKEDVNYYIMNYRERIPTRGASFFHHISRLIEEIEVIHFDYHHSYIEYREVRLFGKEFYDLLDLVMKYFSMLKPKTTNEALTVVKKGFRLRETIKILEQDGYEIIKNIPLHKDDKENTSILSINQAKESVDMIHLVEKYGYIIITEISITQQELLRLKKLRINNYKSLTSISISDFSETGKRLKTYKYRFPANMSVSDFPKTVKEFASLIKSLKFPNGSSILTANSVKSNIKIKEKFKRPKLQINNNYKENIIAEIDISRPEKELIAYIKHLKKDIDHHDDKIMTPSDLLDSIIHDRHRSNHSNSTSSSRIADKEKLPIKAEMFAEMFFVWDYIETRARNNSAHNAILEKNLNKELNHIKNSDNFDLQKTKKIQEAQKYYRDNKFIVSKRDLCKDEMSKEDIQLPSGTIVKRYEALRPFIIEGKYRDLVSNIRK